MKVLLSAYACEPDIGSEQAVGWNWLQNIVSECDVTVITRSNSKQLIEKWVQNNPGCLNATFYYMDCGPLALFLKKLLPGGTYIYYYLWQRKLGKSMPKITGGKRYDLYHHITFASFRMPVGLKGTPMVWGPVGGAELAPLRLLKGYGSLNGRARELFRNLATIFASKCVSIWQPIMDKNGIALASTPATHEILRRQGIPTKLMATIGYDLVSDQHVDRCEDEAPLRLLYVGRLHLLKGLHLALGAIAKIKRGKIQFTIVGEGPERSRLSILAGKLGISNEVEFLGHIPNQMLDEVYSTHKLLIAPSLYESGGLSILEAFAHGLPAIVLDCGGPALSVAQGCGHKICMNQSKSETIQHIADAIQKYINHPELLRQHGANAKSHLESEYLWEKKKLQMMKVYKELITNTKSTNTKT